MAGMTKEVSSTMIDAKEISKCYDNERNIYKRDELLYFAGMLD